MCLLAKEMVDGNVVERASRRNPSRQLTIGVALTKRQSCCQRLPQWDFLDVLPAIPHENVREKAVRKRRDPISGVEVRNVGPVVEMLVVQCVPRAPGIADTGVDGARLVNPRIRRIH